MAFTNLMLWQIQLVFAACLMVKVSRDNMRDAFIQRGLVKTCDDEVDLELYAENDFNTETVYDVVLGSTIESSFPDLSVRI